MKSRCMFAVAVLVVFGLLFPGFAIGQTSVLEADCTQDAHCSTLKEQAAERSKSGDLVEALRLYKLAYEVRPDPRLLFNIARLLHKQGKSAEAVPYYQQFMDAPIQDEEQQQQKAREYLEQIQAVQTTPQQTQTKQSPSLTTNSRPAQAVRVDPPPAGKPIYRKWWFWTVIGGGVLAITAVGIGVGLSQRQPNAPYDINMYEPSF